MSLPKNLEKLKCPSYKKRHWQALWVTNREMYIRKRELVLSWDCDQQNIPAIKEWELALIHLISLLPAGESVPQLLIPGCRTGDGSIHLLAVALHLTASCVFTAVPTPASPVTPLGWISQGTWDEKHGWDFQAESLSFGNSWTWGVDRCGCCWGAFGEKDRAHFHFSRAPYPGLKLKVCQMGQGTCIGGTFVAYGASAALYVSRESTDSRGRGTQSLVPIHPLQPW